MPDDNRGRLFAIVTGLFVALVAAIILVGVFQEGRKLGQQEGRQQFNSVEYAGNASDEIEKRCLPLSDIAQADCIREVVEATNEHDRDERDLVAQTRMATWAFGMFVVTAVAAAITGLGVWFVKRTLDQTSETNKAALNAAYAASEANDIMRAEQRPWVAIDFDISQLKVAFPDDFEADVEYCALFPEWTFQLTNYGGSPAENCTYMFNACDAREIEHDNVMGEIEKIVKCTQERQNRGRAMVIFPNAPSTMITRNTLLGGKSRMRCFYIFVAVAYDTINGKRSGVDARAVAVNLDGRSVTGIMDLPDHRITR